jgi:hypothetical protein
MGDGFNARVNALAVHNGVLYAGGNFTQSGGTQVSRLARWHPESARWISAGEFDGNVFALASVSSSKLIVGGEFSIVDGTPARALVGGEPGSWQAVASIDGSVYALSPDTIERPDNFFLPDRTSLAVGGEYVSGDARNIGLLTVETFSGPVIIDHLESLGQGVNGRVNTIYAHQSPNYGDLVGASVIVIGGEFTEADGRSANRIARCDLGSDRHYWSGFGDGVDDFVGAVSMFNDEVVITGEFTATGARPANRLVRWTLDPLSSCLGDANGDGVVNFSDLNAVLTDFGETGSGNPGDINGDGVINFEDLNTVLTNFGFVCE